MTDERRVSVADGKRSLTKLLREARETHQPILIFNERRNELAGALLSPEDYERYQRLSAYFEALRLSESLSDRKLGLSDLIREARQTLEERGE